MSLLGRIVAVNGQWNCSVHGPVGWPKKAEIDPSALKKYGYESMAHFRNWRWYKGLGGGPVVDFGSHQIDVYNWFLDARPTSVLASGRMNCHDRKTREWHDTVMVVYEYETPQGAITASYQILTANRHDGCFERFLGDQGTLDISERSDRTRLYPDGVSSGAAVWVACVKKDYLSVPLEWREMVEKGMTAEQFAVLFVDESLPLQPMAKPLACDPQVKMSAPPHQPHLENFFAAIRGKAKLTCPAEVGYETAATVLRVNEAIETGHRLLFKPEDFVCPVADQARATEPT
jgi:predicted dehydrogenase